MATKAYIPGPKGPLSLGPPGAGSKYSTKRHPEVSQYIGCVTTQLAHMLLLIHQPSLSNDLQAEAKPAFIEHIFQWCLNKPIETRVA